jgi:hypothetical protein
MKSSCDRLIEGHLQATRIAPTAANMKQRTSSLQHCTYSRVLLNAPFYYKVPDSILAHSHSIVLSDGNVLT